MMNRKYDYYKDEEDRDINISGMLKYTNSKQEIDKFLEKIISSYISNKQLKVLDACCGIGHLVDHLSSISPESMFYGWDQTSYLIEKAKQLFQHKQNVNFEVIDIYDFPDNKKSSFDISIDGT